MPSETAAKVAAEPTMQRQGASAVNSVKPKLSGISDYVSSFLGLLVAGSVATVSDVGMSAVSDGAKPGSGADGNELPAERDPVVTETAGKSSCSGRSMFLTAMRFGWTSQIMVMFRRMVSLRSVR